MNKQNQFLRGGCRGNCNSCNCGEEGCPAEVGPRGPAGEQGPVGEQGPIGPQGPAGAQGPVGPQGPAGEQGPMGPQGPVGEQGAVGPQGPTGVQGPVGPRGPAGEQGPIGPQGPAGVQGPAGPQGPAGEQGPRGNPGCVSDFGEFYALIPPDMNDTVSPGSDVSFPRDGITRGTAVRRRSHNTFLLEEEGVYLVRFRVGVCESGQLVLTLNDRELEHTVTGRAAGTSQIAGEALVSVESPCSLLTLRNPAGGRNGLTATPRAGGSLPASARIMILRLC